MRTAMIPRGEGKRSKKMADIINFVRISSFGLMEHQNSILLEDSVNL